MTITTVDGDLPENSNVSYKIVGGPAGGPDRLQDFRIHPLTGDVTVARLLDREVRDEYALKVQATDGAWKLETVITGECTVK